MNLVEPDRILLENVITCEPSQALKGLNVGTLSNHGSADVALPKPAKWRWGLINRTAAFNHFCCQL